jgi:hypothetical protein
MNSIKSVLTTVTAVFVGVALGVFLSRPPSVKALSGIRLQKVSEGYNTVIGSDYIGFACTQTDCYIATH